MPIPKLSNNTFSKFELISKIPDSTSKMNSSSAGPTSEPLSNTTDGNPKPKPKMTNRTDNRQRPYPTGSTRLRRSSDKEENTKPSIEKTDGPTKPRQSPQATSIRKRAFEVEKEESGEGTRMMKKTDARKRRQRSVQTTSQRQRAIPVKKKESGEETGTMKKTDTRKRSVQKTSRRVRASPIKKQE
ncbi:hypothetical protein BDW59DRAFT_143627 [Aspergillus cavernicola]|uniref:Uncharacterized protein n=1 Tax=Aspergillus cavernicola TaxID=176166 RepID=A0ABR4IJS6_9EURO